MAHRNPLTLVYQTLEFNQHSQAIARGIAAYVRHHADWHLRVTIESLARVIPALKAQGVDGAIVRPNSEADERRMAACGIPCILTRTSNPQKVLPYITANNRLLGQMAAQHFIDKGFTSFAYCAMISDRFWSQERLDGFTERVRKAGGIVHMYSRGSARSRAKALPATTSRLWSWMGEARQLYAWLRSLPKPIGIFAAEDGVGHDILEAAMEAGIKVPEEIAVLGTYNEVTRCLLSNPPLSSIAMDLEQTGYNAAALLHRIIMGKEKMRGQRLTHEPLYIVTRQSSDILAVNDSDLASALHFIRTNINRPIRVSDVVKQTALSRRGLEIRFRDHLRHSITDEIMRVRVDKVVNMLLESDMSMERIADCLAFCSPGHMTTVFKRFRGTTPNLFRREHRKT